MGESDAAQPRAKRLALPPLLPIVDVRGCEAPSGVAISDLVGFATAVAEAGCSLIQLRGKELPAGALLDLAARLRNELSAHQSRLIVNDRADIAAAVGAVGVHLGQTDLPVEAARKTLGSGALIGLSTHTLEDVWAAAATSGGARPDYLGFGPVFASPTKPGARSPRGVAVLAQACAASPLPIVAIGGVTVEHATRVWRAGAASVAVISELERATDPQALAARYFAAFAAISAAAKDQR